MMILVVQMPIVRVGMTLQSALVHQGMVATHLTNDVDVKLSLVQQDRAGQMQNVLPTEEPLSASALEVILGIRILTVV